MLAPDSIVVASLDIAGTDRAQLAGKEGWAGCKA